MKSFYPHRLNAGLFLLLVAAFVGGCAGQEQPDLNPQLPPGSVSHIDDETPRSAPEVRTEHYSGYSAVQ